MYDPDAIASRTRSKNKTPAVTTKTATNLRYSGEVERHESPANKYAKVQPKIDTGMGIRSRTRHTATNTSNKKVEKPPSPAKQGTSATYESDSDSAPPIQDIRRSALREELAVSTGSSTEDEINASRKAKIEEQAQSDSDISISAVYIDLGT